MTSLPTWTVMKATGHQPDGQGGGSGGSGSGGGQGHKSVSPCPSLDHKPCPSRGHKSVSPCPSLDHKPCPSHDHKSVSPCPSLDHKPCPSRGHKSVSPCPSLVQHIALDDERILTDMYKFGEKLGKGSFGVVWHVTHIGTGEHYACKSINKEKVSKK